MAELTREDLRETAADLKGYMKDRCDGIDRRLDTANGRMNKHDRELGEHHADLEMIKQELFNSIVQVEEPADEGSEPALTKSNVKFIGAVIAGTTIVLEAAHAAWQFFMAVKH
jgi:hypothetical protein